MTESGHIDLVGRAGAEIFVTETANFYTKWAV